MKNLTRMITADGSAMACAVNATELVSAMEHIHQTSAVVTAGLGRLSIAAALMGYLLKGENDSLTLRIRGDGPAGALVAVANAKGEVKSYVENPVVELPLNAYGKLDVKGAIGSNGTLSVVKDLGLKEPYVGQVPLVSGEIAEDITAYYASSEQTPTVCGLGVLVNPDLTVQAAGGFLVQLLPFADESCIDTIEENLKNLPAVSSMIAEGVTPAEICSRLLAGLEPEVLDEGVLCYRCDCSRERVTRALASLSGDEIRQMLEEEHGCQVSCHFCTSVYRFNEAELTELLQKKEAPNA